MAPKEHQKRRGAIIMSMIHELVHVQSAMPWQITELGLTDSDTRREIAKESRKPVMIEDAGITRDSCLGSNSREETLKVVSVAGVNIKFRRSGSVDLGFPMSQKEDEDAKKTLPRPVWH